MSFDLERALGALSAACERAEPGATAEFVERVGRLVGEACEADGHLFLRIDPDSGLWLDVAHDGLPDGQCAAYLERAFLRTPWGDHAAWGLARERCRTITPSTRPDPYVDDVVRGFGFRFEWHLNVASRGVCRGHLTLSRTDGCFPPHVGPYLRRANGILWNALRRLRADETIASVPGERLGLIAVAADGRLEAANARGAELLDEVARTEPCRRTHVFSALGHLVGARGLATAPPLLYVDRDGYRYRVGAERLLAGSGTWTAMLVVEPLRALDSRELLCQLGLTEREASVALTVLRGLSSEHGSRSLDMAEHTWLSHLKGVYRKLGVGSRSELASVLVGA